MSYSSKTDSATVQGGPFTATTGRARSWQRHPEVFAYLPRQVVVHLAVAGNSAASV